jgi:hypothetical protein
MAKNKNPKSKWTTVPDSNVRHVWANADGSGEVTVSPDYYGDNGTPVCCDEESEFFEEDMVYVRTEILT